MIDREMLGRRVRQVWLIWAREQTNPKPHHLLPWEGMAESDKEVDRRIGETIASEVLLRAIAELEVRAYRIGRDALERVVCRECGRDISRIGHAPHCLVGHVLDVLDDVGSVVEPSSIVSEKIEPEDEAALAVYAATRTSVAARALVGSRWEGHPWTLARQTMQQAMRDLAEPAYALGVRDTLSATKEGSESTILDMQHMIDKLRMQHEHDKLTCTRLETRVVDLQNDLKRAQAWWRASFDVGPPVGSHE